MCMWTKKVPDNFKRNPMWACFSKILVKFIIFQLSDIVFNIRTLYLGAFIWKGITELDLHRAMQRLDFVRRRASE